MRPARFSRRTFLTALGAGLAAGAAAPPQPTLAQGVARDGWRRTAPFQVDALFASGAAVWAWDAYMMIASRDGGRTWSAPFSPAPPAVDAAPSQIRSAAARPDGGGGVLLSDGRLALFDAQGGVEVSDVAGVSQIAADARGGLWASSGPGQRLFALAPRAAPVARGRGRILFSARPTGVVVADGDRAAHVTRGARQDLRWRGGASYLPQYGDAPAITGPLAGRLLTRDGRQWRVRDGRLDGSVA